MADKSFKLELYKIANDILKSRSVPYGIPEIQLEAERLLDNMEQPTRTYEETREINTIPVKSVIMCDNPYCCLNPKVCGKGVELPTSL